MIVLIFLFLLDKKNQRAIYHAVMYEAVAREKYLAMMATDVESCGRFVSEETPFFSSITHFFDDYSIFMPNWVENKSWILLPNSRTVGNFSNQNSTSLCVYSF